MPSLSIYVNREIYDYLSKLAGPDKSPESEAKKWLEERYKMEMVKILGLMRLEEKEEEDGR